jgi:hypothetical protein
MKASDLDAELRSFGMRSVACCDDCRQAAARERAARDESERGHHGAPDHIRKAVLGEHDRKIAEHDRGVMTHARRAAYAEEGFLLDGPDERADGDHARRYGSLQAAAHAAGRVRHYQVYDDGLGDDDDEDNGDE